MKVLPQKILMVTNVDFSLRHFLLPLMRAATAAGHEVVGVCAEGPLLADVRAEGLRVEALPLARSLSPLAQLRAFRALYALIRAERPDLVHGHMPISGFLARLAARLAARPADRPAARPDARHAGGSGTVPRVAYTCHGFLFNQPGPRWRRALALAIEWTGGRMTDVFLTVSTEEAADARRLHIHRNPQPIGNGRDPARFRPDPAARTRIRAELGCAPGTVVIVILSRLVRHKGHPELLEAMHRVTGAELWVVGERLASDHGESLEPLFARAGPWLRRLGYRADNAAILAAADIFCLPSWFEGLPMSVIEAMLTALPVVATDIRGPREQVLEGETGLLVPPGDPARLAAALQALVDDPELRTRLGQSGRTRAIALYDEAQVIARTLEALGLNAPAPSPPLRPASSIPGPSSRAKRGDPGAA